MTPAGRCVTLTAGTRSFRDHCCCSGETVSGRDRIGSAAELDGLSAYAVVYDHNNQVWQKLPYPSIGVDWFKPGDEIGYSADCIALPAWLLDDGL